MNVEQDKQAQATHLEQELEAFRSPELARELVAAIHQWAQPGTTLMEVCGTHTMAIARQGIRDLMPEGLRLASGPGCPVCVTANADIDAAIALAEVPDVVITTFGDMMRVPGSTTSLAGARAQGRDVRVVYSPLDALTIARENPTRPVIFIAVGFETTTPLTARALLRARDEGLSNFFVSVAHKNMPGALEAIVSDPSLSVSGLLLPGHVSTIIGEQPYQFLAKRYGIPGVICGFELVDILQGIAMLTRQLAEGRAEIENAYERSVRSEGNPVALAAIDEVFETCDVEWRGLGVIPGSGYRLRDEWRAFDALERFQPTVEPTKEPMGCRCGDVLRSAITPDQCPLFDKACTPETPLGPCMVSSEGTCAAYWRYYRS